MKVGDRLYCINNRSNSNKSYYDNYNSIGKFYIINKVYSDAVWMGCDDGGVCYYSLIVNDDRFLGDYFITFRELRKLKLDLLKSRY